MEHHRPKVVIGDEFRERDTGRAKFSRDLNFLEKILGLGRRRKLGSEISGETNKLKKLNVCLSQRERERT